MAAPSYTTDLNDICLMETGDSFEEFNGYALGDNAALETDWYLQGSSCASDEANNKTGVGHSIGFDYGSTITFNSGDVFLGWIMCMAGNAMDTFANGGYRVLMGSSTSVFYGWYVGGRDFGRNPYGGWVNVAVDPTATPQDTGNGTPTTWQHFGVAFKMTSGISKGRPLCADAFRYGRAELILTAGDLSNGYATFTGAAAQNDASANRWGLLQSEGTGFLWKGLLTLGTSGTAVDMRDSNVNVTIDDCPRTYAAFNRIEVNNSGSNVEWTGVNFVALNASGVSIGQFEMIDNAVVDLDGCSFTDMSTFIFQSNAIVNGTTFRRCGQVTQGGADFDGCLFDQSAAAVALLVSNPNNVDDCRFVSDGTGHAIELTSACAGNSYTAVDWFVSGYASSNGSTGNEVIYNNSGGAVTINVDGGSGATALTYRNGTGASTSIVASFSYTVKGLEQNTEVTFVTAGTSTELFHVENATTSDGDGKYQVTYSHSGGATVDVLIHHVNYKPDISNILGVTLPSANAEVKVQMFADENYFNPT
jgi:hypothetical protein